MAGLLVRLHIDAGQQGFRDASSKQISGFEWPLALAECHASRIDRSNQSITICSFLQVYTSGQHGNNYIRLTVND